MTELEARETMRLMAQLWPQTKDLVDNEAMLDVWRRALKPLDATSVREALKAYRASQERPFRPEPGQIRELLRRYGQQRVASCGRQPPIYVQAVDVPADFVPNGQRGGLGRYHELLYTDGRPRGHEQRLADARRWAGRLAERTGLVWAVIEGASVGEMGMRRHVLGWVDLRSPNWRADLQRAHERIRRVCAAGQSKSRTVEAASA